MRDEGKPQTQTVEFLSPVAVTGTLQILNGGENETSPKKRVSSAVISLNGVKVIGPDRFNQDTALIEQHVQLSAGTNRLAVTLSSSPRSLLQITVQSDFPVGGVDLRADPPGFFVQTSAAVRVQARVREAANPAPAALELLPLSSSGGIESTPACTMTDDGQAVFGDDAAGDGIYTCMLSLFSATNQDFSYMAHAVVGGTGLYSRPLVIKAVEPIQAADLQTMQAVQEAAADHWTNAAAKYGDALKAKLDTAAFIRGLDGVANAGVSEDDQTIWIRFKSGLHFAFFDTPEDAPSADGESNSLASTNPQTLGGPLINSEPARSLSLTQAGNNLVGNNKALIWEPFFAACTNIPPAFQGATCPRFADVRPLQYEQADVNSAGTFSQYGTVVVLSHGGILSNEPQLPLNGQFGFATGQLVPDCALSPNGPNDPNCIDQNLHLLRGIGALTFSAPLREIQNCLQTPIRGKTWWTITPKFFESLPVAAFPNSIVYVGTCHSADNSTLKNKLIDRGVAAYFGWTGLVSYRTLDDAVELFENFKGSTTAVEAFSKFGLSNSFFQQRAKLFPADSSVRYSTDEEISFTGNQPTGTVSTSRPTITARIDAAGHSCIRPFESVNLLVDGNWIRSGCNGCFETPPDEPVTSVQISYTPDMDYAPGPHTAKVVATSESGLIKDFEWNFSTTQQCSVAFYISVDDYAKLYIDDRLVASYDGYPWGYASVSLDLDSGWHDIRLDYANRYGSTHFSFYYKLPGDPDFRIVPQSALRSTDVSGNVISGLRAQYSGEGRSFTVYGEGPIQHGWYNLYEGRSSALWANQFDVNWGKFSESLSGEILIGSCGQ